MIRLNLAQNLTRCRNKFSNISKRQFQSRSEYEEWTRRMKLSRVVINNEQLKIQQVSVKRSAPFLYSVSPISDRLLLFEIGDAIGESADTHTKAAETGNAADSVIGKSPFASMLECIYPLSEERYATTNLSSSSSSSSSDRADLNDLEILRASVSDLGAWSSFRLAKFYSDVDALTADVAYRHASSSNVAFVTAGHYHSRKIRRTDLSRDIILRCYPTHTGRSSIEVRTDLLQKDDETEEEHLINVCFTSMVAVDKQSLRPVKDVIPPLIPAPINEDVDRQRIRKEMAEQHGKIRKARFATSMQLRHGPSSSPPTQEEMDGIHSLHQLVITNQQRQSKPNTNVERVHQKDPPLPHIKQHTYRSSVVVYPERRNVHGKLFGGFIMEQSHILAQYAADFYLHHEEANPCDVNFCSDESKERLNDNDNIPMKKVRAIPLGMDEAIFLQPVSIGDHVTFTARVVHSTPRTCRVLVLAEVRDPSSRHLLPMRSNRLSFLFGCDSTGGKMFPRGIVPDAYGEILMNVDSSRRLNVEGPLDEEVEKILGH